MKSGGDLEELYHRVREVGEHIFTSEAEAFPHGLTVKPPIQDYGRRPQCPGLSQVLDEVTVKQHDQVVRLTLPLRLDQYSLTQKAAGL